MKNGSNWHLQPVGQFFEELNWLGLIQSITPHQPTAMTVNWRSLAVDEFLQQVNWDGIARPALSAHTAVPIPDSWALYSVTDFFEGVNWQGLQVILPPATTVPEPESAAAPPIPLTWKSWPVESFFERLNWNGDITGIVPLGETTSLWRLSVTDFSRGIVWEGRRAIAHVETPPEQPAPEDDTMTLTNLSGLF